MPVPKSYEEYKQELATELNWLEGLTDDATSLDERLDVTNRLLIHLANRQGIDPDLLIQVLEALNNIAAALDVNTAENPKEVLSRTKTLPTANTAEQFPQVFIPYDHEVIIKAADANSGTAYVGNSKPEAEDTTLSYPLVAGQAVGYKIRNLNQLWACSSASGDKVIFSVEQWGGGV